MNTSSRVDDYLPFELIVDSRVEDGYPISVVESPAGEAMTYSPMQFDRGLLAMLDDLHAGQADGFSMRSLGEAAFDRLFSGTIRSLFRKSLTLARHEGKRLRVRLRIRPSELAAFPWELLFDSEEQLRLAAASNLSLVRNLAGADSPRPARVELPLRILVVGATPADVEPIDIDREFRSIDDALQERVETGHILVEKLTHATLDGFERMVLKFRPHVVHLITHGLYQDGRGYLLFEDDEGFARLLNAEQIGTIAGGCSETRLIVLNACQSATLYAPEALTDLAPKMLGGNLGALVAMQQRMTDRVAALFTRSLYRRLASGMAIDAAVNEARQSMLADSAGDDVSWSSPTIYLRGRSGDLFRLDDDQPTFAPNFPVPQPTAPPQIPGFVGREAELGYYADRLEEFGVAAIVGMAGVGKSSLASKLAAWVAKSPDLVFWHQFHAGENLEAVLWDLGAFLAFHGHPGLWNTIQSANRANVKLPPPETLFSSALHLLRGNRFLICLDDFHHVDDDPVLNRFIQQLRSALAAREMALIVTSRRMPDALSVSQFDPLMGLSLDDTRRLLLLRRLRLDEPQVADLHRLTDGNATFLTLAVDALTQGRTAHELLQGLSTSRDVERYLLREVDDTLSGRERTILEAVAICLGYTVSRDAVEVIVGGGNQYRSLAELTDRHLLYELRGGETSEYGIHAILQRFYYDQISVSRRHSLHLRAATHYLADGSKALLSATHYEAADQSSSAIEVLKAHYWTCINKGQIKEVQSLLERMILNSLSPSVRTSCIIALGRTYEIAGLSHLARSYFSDLLTVLERKYQTPDIAVNIAEVCLAYGESLADHDPRSASNTLTRGLEILPEASRELRAKLLIAFSNSELRLTHYDEAVSALEEALLLLPKEDISLRIQTLTYLSGVKFAQGSLEESINVSTLAIDIGEASGDYLHLIQALNNRGNALAVSGIHISAKSDFERAVKLAEQIGDESTKATLLLNIGLVYEIMGDTQRAVSSLYESCRHARYLEKRDLEISVRLQLAALLERIGEVEELDLAISELDELVDDSWESQALANYYTLKADLALARNQVGHALDLSATALEYARIADDGMAVGAAQRSLGRARMLEGDYAQARKLLEDSTSNFSQIDPYESARSKLLLARIEFETGELSECKATLLELNQEVSTSGGQVLLAEVASMLARLDQTVSEH